jgi:hypothetical protein
LSTSVELMISTPVCACTTSGAKKTAAKSNKRHLVFIAKSPRSFQSQP